MKHDNNRSAAGIDSSADPLLLSVVAKIAQRLPRGKGAFSRAVGRLFADYLSNCHFTTRYGAKLAISPSSLDFYATAKQWGNSWEHWVFDTCRWALPAEGVFYDIGANVGYMSIEMLQQLPASRAVLFEPQPKLVQVIQKSIALNHLQQRAQLLPIALSDSSGSAALNLFANDGHASLSDGNPGQRQITVKMMTLDEAGLAYNLPPPDLIKIDVEGHELSVLRGGAQLLRSARPCICFECSSQSQYAAIRGMLAEMGDYIFIKAFGSYRPVQVMPEVVDFSTAKLDFLAIDSSRQAQLPVPLASLFSERSKS
jgi:FkbM family methyltransferase